jgi:serine/threonine-protein kinase OSR1/STK39
MEDSAPQGATDAQLGAAAACESWPTSAQSYELIGKIGQGAFATVWRAHVSEKKACAVKVLNLDHVDTNLSEIRQEVQAMRLSAHPNVLTCHTAFVSNTQLWLVTPLMRKGSSLHCLQTARRVMRTQQQQQQQQEGEARVTPSMEDHILYILHETLLGLQYIHENGQIHRDIKAGNILLDGNGDVRIADFGVSGWLVQAGSQQEKAKTFVGTPAWMAPEVMEQVHGYDTKADLWSLGITALELAKGYAPYAKYPPMKVLILTIQEDPPSLDSYDEDEDDDDCVDEEFSTDFRSLVSLCLQRNPSKRPTCRELLHSKNFNIFKESRARCRENMKTQVCDLVQDVGTEGDVTTTNTRHLPGNTPVSIVLSQQQENDRPAGTTWVFADGSQVLSSSATITGTVHDVLEELDEFGKQTGGEHYSAMSGTEATTVDAPIGEKSNDDLDAFMDEFEQNTAGEDFRRSPKDL